MGAWTGKGWQNWWGLKMKANFPTFFYLTDMDNCMDLGKQN